MSVDESVRPHHKDTKTYENIEIEACDGSRDSGLVVAAVQVGDSPCDVLPVVGNEADCVDGGDELTAEVEQEVERVASLPSYQPTKCEYAEHCVTHSPYRLWCRHCCGGRGQEFGHVRRKEHDPNRAPMVAFDYAGVRGNGEFVNPIELKGVEDDESVARMLVVALRTHDDRQSCVFGHVVSCKGVDREKFTVDCLVSDIV